MQVEKTEYKYNYGLTVKQLAERVMQRDTTEDVIQKFCAECANALENGEKINLSGIGTLTPSIHAPVTMNIFDEEDERRVPYVTVNYHRNNKLKDKMNNKYRKNIENGFAGLSEHCICNTQQRNTLIRKGIMEGEIEDVEDNQ